MEREAGQRRLGLHGSGCEGITATDHVAGNAADYLYRRPTRTSKRVPTPRLPL
jgi:hypothetical protein